MLLCEVIKTQIIMIELKIFAYWICLLIISYIIARLDHFFSRTNVYFKYYDSWTRAIYNVVKIIGLFIIICWLFIQFTNYFFKGEFVPLTELY
jgi:hypothetical protein